VNPSITSSVFDHVDTETMPDMSVSTPIFTTSPEIWARAGALAPIASPATSIPSISLMQRFPIMLGDRVCVRAGSGWQTRFSRCALSETQYSARDTFSRGRPGCCLAAALLSAGVRQPCGKRGDGGFVRHALLLFEHEVTPRRSDDGMRSDEIGMGKIRSQQALDGDGRAQAGRRGFDGEAEILEAAPAADRYLGELRMIEPAPPVVRGLLCSSGTEVKSSAPSFSRAGVQTGTVAIGSRGTVTRPALGCPSETAMTAS